MMLFDEYLSKVVKLAKSLGYSKIHTLHFYCDIQQCYFDGVSVEECVEEIF